MEEYKSFSQAALRNLGDSITSNLGAWYAYATDAQREAGALWYRIAHGIVQDLADETCMEYAEVLRVTAIASQRTRWSSNIETVEKWFRDGIAQHTFKDVIVKIVTGAQPTGQKILSFQDSIDNCGMGDNVCVDSWAYRAAAAAPGVKCPVEGTIGASVYPALQEYYRQAAREYAPHLTSQQFQAVVWCAIRGAID